MVNGLLGYTCNGITAKGEECQRCCFLSCGYDGEYYCHHHLPSRPYRPMPQIRRKSKQSKRRRLQITCSTQTATPARFTCSTQTEHQIMNIKRTVTPLERVWLSYKNVSLKMTNANRFIITKIRELLQKYDGIQV